VSGLEFFAEKPFLYSKPGLLHLCIASILHKLLLELLRQFLAYVLVVPIRAVDSLATNLGRSLLRKRLRSGSK
jgi:hypothetical protein